jgi:hypothetical protein
LSHIGCESQDDMRTAYWQDKLHIPVGQQGGIWDHVQVYADTNWPRGEGARHTRRKVYEKKERKAFDEVCRLYHSPFQTSLVVKATCGNRRCGRTGMALKSAAVCHIQPGDLVHGLVEAVQESWLDSVSKGTTKCSKCKENMEMCCIEGESTLASLLVVQLIGTHKKPLIEETVVFGGEWHGTYMLCGTAQFGRSPPHWICTYRIGDLWYRYDDLNRGIVRLESFLQQRDGFLHKVLFYITTHE